jgi:hypothetical protein
MKQEIPQTSREAPRVPSEKMRSDSRSESPRGWVVKKRHNDCVASRVKRNLISLVWFSAQKQNNAAVSEKQVNNKRSENSGFSSVFLSFSLHDQIALLPTL